MPQHKNAQKSVKKQKTSRSPGGKRKSAVNDGTPRQRKKPGPKPGSKNKPRQQPKLSLTPILNDEEMLKNMDIDGLSKMDEAEGEGAAADIGLDQILSNEEELEQIMIEDEEYGRRQLELAAIEVAKKKKEDREAKKMEKARQKALEILAAERERDAEGGADGEAPKKKKRGRRSKAEILAEQMRRDATSAPTTTATPTTELSPSVSNPLSTAVGMSMESGDRSMDCGPMVISPSSLEGPLMSNPDGSPMKPKRRGRGKGKKTLAMEAARAGGKPGDASLMGIGADSNPDDLMLPTAGSSTSGSAPSTPPGTSSNQGYPSIPQNQQQSSVITRMLQSQPVSNSPQSFTAAATAMGHKYFGGLNATAPNPMMGGGQRPGYEMQVRGRIPSPYRQLGQQPNIPPHFAAVRSGTPPMRLRVPGPMYHTPHHPMDPSPSGGGPISINNRDRNSPLSAVLPGMIPPTSASPLGKGGPTPPPPPYIRSGPSLARFPDGPLRHQLPPFVNSSPGGGMQQPSPPPSRPPGNFSPYHPPPPNYHYGAYPPPPPPMSGAEDGAPAYQGPPSYPSEQHFSTSAGSPASIQGPPVSSTSQCPQSHAEEGSGEFGGLVSYFSSQREDDLES